MYTLTILEHNLHKQHIYGHHISKKSYNKNMQMNHICTIGEKDTKTKT